MTEYTIHIATGMRVRHDAQARVTVTSGRAILEDRLTSIASIGGAVTAASIVYNALSYSGGVSWWNPATGKPISRPKIALRVRAQDVLTGEQECQCPECVGEHTIN